MRMPRLLFAVVALGCGGAPAAAETPAPEAAAPAPEAAAPEASADDGSLGLSNERRMDETLVTGGQPDGATLRRAAERGVTTVISLRTEGEPGYDAEAQRALAEELGMRFVSIPVGGADGVTEENARALDEALAAGEGPTLLYCGSGNRAGALLALRAFHVEGKSAEEALALGRAAGLTGLEESVRAHLEAWCETREC